jgi:hypothetical protein
VAVNDFWNRLAGGPDAEEIGPRITVWSFLATAKDLVLPGANGVTMAIAEQMWQLSGDALTEFNDLASSINTLNNANAVLRRAMRMDAVEGIGASAALGEQGDFPGNPFVDANGLPSGEAIRLRAQSLITALGGTPQGTLAA